MLKNAFASPAALARFFIPALAGLALDLWTKSLAMTHLQFGQSVDFIPNFLQFEYTQNHGAVFGVAQGQRWIFLIVSAAALVFLSYLFATSGKRRFYQFVLGMLLAGVLGNMFDRIAYGFVRDMIHALPGWRWPDWIWSHLPFLPAEVFPWIFNVADTLLCTGVGLMLLYSLFHAPAPAKTEDKISTP